MATRMCGKNIWNLYFLLASFARRRIYTLLCFEKMLCKTLSRLTIGIVIRIRGVNLGHGKEYNTLFDKKQRRAANSPVITYDVAYLPLRYALEKCIRED